MEKFRMRFMEEDMGLRPLGKTKPGRVIENLGKTGFHKSTPIPTPSLSAPNPSSNLHNDDDDLDLFSSKNTSPVMGLNKPCMKFDLDRDCSKRDVKNKYSATHCKSNLGSDVDNDKAMPPSNQLALKVHRQLPSSKGKNSSSPLLEISSNRDKKGKGKMVGEVAPFPMSCSPPNVTDRRKDDKKKSVGRQPEPFPDILSPGSVKKSPFKKKTVSRKKIVRSPQAFPMDISPEKASTSRKFTKKVVSDEEDEGEDELALSSRDAILTYGAPRPFPMALDIPSQESQHSKRTAGDSEDDKASKRSRPSPEPDELFDSSILIDKNADPSSLCPYCDEAWPSTPSPTLIGLLEVAKRKSYRDPRPGNSMGLTAPLTVFVEVCQRHRFERTHLPLAIERGWPSKLNFEGLPKRILSFKKIITRVVHNPTLSCFWRDLRDDMQEVGKTKIASVTGQFATFERALPGYYGEQGSIIIHQTLYSAFPTDTISTSIVHPLSADQFITHVLVPETALLLIKEDMSLDTKEDAVRVMQESRQYGALMFPEQAQSDDVAQVGERLAWERAKKQRKVLQARGETDADVRRQVEQEERQAKWMKPKEMKRMNDKSSFGTLHESEGDDDRDARTGKQEVMEMVKKPKPKWRKVAKPPSKKPNSHCLDVDLKRKLTLPPQDSLSTTEWNFNLRTDRDSSDRSDIDFDALTEECGQTPDEVHAVDSDSKYKILADEPIPKPSRIHKTPPNKSEKKETAIQNQKRVTEDITNLKNERKSTTTKKSKPVLGQTKRRKKEATAGGKQCHDWLFSDSDSN